MRGEPSDEDEPELEPSWPRGAIGYVLNGVKFDAGTNGGCNDDPSACSPTDQALDECRALTQGHVCTYADGQAASIQGTCQSMPDALFPLGGYPGDEDDARAQFAKLEQPKTREVFVTA